MYNLIFLEAAIQSERAETVIGSNESLIAFATAEVDALVEEQFVCVSKNINLFMESNIIQTKNSISDSVFDIVSVSTSIFSEIISSDLSTQDKQIAIEGASHIISMGDYDLIDEAFISKKAIGGMVAGTAGGIAGGALGSRLGAASANLSRSYFKLKKLITQETDIRNKMKTKNSPELKKQLAQVIKDKEEAKSKYEQVKAKRSRIGSAIGGTAGGVAAGAAYSAKTGGGDFKSNLKSGAIGAAAGMAASKVGGLAGSALAAFSKQRKSWKVLVKQEKRFISKKSKSAADNKKLAQISKEKAKARAEYDAVREKAKGLGSMAGGLLGTGLATKGIGKFIK